MTTPAFKCFGDENEERPHWNSSDVLFSRGVWIGSLNDHHHRHRGLPAYSDLERYHADFRQGYFPRSSNGPCGEEKMAVCRVAAEELTCSKKIPILPLQGGLFCILEELKVPSNRSLAIYRFWKADGEYTEDIMLLGTTYSSRQHGTLNTIQSSRISAGRGLSTPNEHPSQNVGGEETAELPNRTIFPSTEHITVSTPQMTRPIFNLTKGNQVPPNPAQVGNSNRMNASGSRLASTNEDSDSDSLSSVPRYIDSLFAKCTKPTASVSTSESPSWILRGGPPRKHALNGDRRPQNATRQKRQKTAEPGSIRTSPECPAELANIVRQPLSGNLSQYSKSPDGTARGLSDALAIQECVSNQGPPAIAQVSKGLSEQQEERVTFIWTFFTTEQTSRIVVSLADCPTTSSFFSLLSEEANEYDEAKNVFNMAKFWWLQFQLPGGSKERIKIKPGRGQVFRYLRERIAQAKFWTDGSDGGLDIEIVPHFGS
ncbi:hypothetical protein K432DRAFT_398359 [Lepidopterella palustris CBS 459.81]|uniref:Uncharacterized protein n=1 Tax=Lepidopterella palustris CBS 459.81 TaxID=1314670 RepID=A0A8E2DYI5_9PEZI|nr:hypothetical protein K432DRAFT_398359 [Lepidopterella palustris CBS 459.81]